MRDMRYRTALLVFMLAAGGLVWYYTHKKASTTSQESQTSQGSGSGSAAMTPDGKPIKIDPGAIEFTRILSFA